jgi:hypothetical protein
MPTKREREYYKLGFRDGADYMREQNAGPREIDIVMERTRGADMYPHAMSKRINKPKRKLSAWNKYVKANSKKPRFRYRNGKLNLKKMAVSFRKTPAGKKKRR